MSRGFLANAFLRASAALRDSMRSAGPGSGTTDDQTPLRAELFSVEQMEQHGKSLAATHVLSTSRPRTRLLERLDENERVLIETFDMLTAAVRSRLRIAPSGEWLLDNFYLIEEQIRTARQHLPKEYSRGLPHLAQGPSRGLPRVYDIALEAISHGDGRVDSRTLARFVTAYQSVTPLTLGELWAIPIMLRLALIENLRRVSARIMTTARIHASEAQRWADQMTEIAESDPKSLILVIADMARSNPPMVEPVRRGTRAPPPGPRARARVAAHLGRAAARRIEPDDRTDGAVGDPAAGSGPGFRQQHDREPALAGRDGLARVRRGHESRRAGAARGSGRVRTA